jgi:hypothetical protein
MTDEVAYTVKVLTSHGASLNISDFYKYAVARTLKEAALSPKEFVYEWKIYCGKKEPDICFPKLHSERFAVFSCNRTK